MDKLNQAVEKLVTQTTSGSRQGEHSQKWTPQTQKLVMGLFSRMATLYQNKSSNYQIMTGNDYSDDFKLWCWKLKDLTPEQFKQGVEMMEYQEAEGRKTGDETWPPSYAGFIGLATMKSGSRSTFIALPPCTLSKEERKFSLQALRDEVGI